MRKLTVLICLLVILLTSCTQGSSVTPESTLTITQTPIATATYTPSPTAMNTPFPDLEGRLFFDMNASTFKDETSFNYDQARLNSPLNQLVREYISTFPDSFYQPEQVVGLQKVIDDYISENPDTLQDQLHPVLLKAIDDYVSAHPGVQDGDLIKIDEPGLPGYTVCVEENCVQTDPQGIFSLPNPSGASRASIKITDPYADFPAWAMRYINKWNKAVTVPAYTKDVDAATMVRLTTIPGCDADLVALVCKFNDATLQLRDQHLNDTSIIPIGNGTSIKLGADNNVGLMQGFLTLPFVAEQVPEPFIISYFDIIGPRNYDQGPTYSSTIDGIVLNYDGKYSTQDIPHHSIVGTGDSHTGLDYLVPIGTCIISSAPTSLVWYLAGPEEPRVDLMFQSPENPGEVYDSDYGHLSVQLVDMNQKIYRGQIVALSGNTGAYYPPPRPPMLHFNLGRVVEGGGWTYPDEYRYEINLTPLPENFWGNPISLWTSDNNPQFSLP